MTGWHQGRLCLIDAETTGVDPHRDRIVTFALLEVGAGAQTIEQNWLVNPGIPIPAGAAAIHGITDEHAATGRTLASAVREIAERILSCSNDSGLPVVGMNVVYDLTLVVAECHRHGLTDFAHMLTALRPVIDTFVLDKQVDPYRKGSRKLIDTCRHYGIHLTDEEAHGARADALAAGRLAWKIAQAYPGDIGSLTPEQLHDAQVAWKRKHADSFGRYLTRQGKTDDVSRDWPVQPPPAGWTPEQLPAVREEALAS